MRPPGQLAAIRPLVPCPAVAVLSRAGAVTAPRSAAEYGEVRVWSRSGLAIVTTPQEVGGHNAQDFWTALAGACVSHRVIIADMTGTHVCGYEAVTALLMALRCTDASGAELWLAVSAAVATVLAGTAIRHAFPAFQRLEDAFASLSSRLAGLL